MNEMYLVIVPPISAMLFALGGTTNKLWRRFVLPGVYFLACLLSASWWQGAIVAVLATGIFCLGYGETKPLWQRILVVASYGLISIGIGISWWNLIAPLGFGMLYILSNLPFSKDTIVWKVVEGVVGLLCGIQVAFILAGYGLRWI